MLDVKLYKDEITYIMYRYIKMKNIIAIISLLTFSNLHSQTYKAKNAAFADKINESLAFTVPLISAKDVINMQNAVILDAREPREYQVSHLPNAKCIGFDKIDQKVLSKIEKDKTIILYCSIGYRSEKVGEKLQKLGYKKVFNLYGSIFEWANLGYPLVTSDGKTTNKIHVFDKNWGRWMENKAYIKIYD
jgi:rhodanese-related sulfurtransferase